MHSRSLSIGGTKKRAILIARQIVAIRRAGLYANEWPRA
jgi:hypothetical protein